MKHHYVYLATAVCLLGSLTMPATAGIIIFSDSEFDRSDWTTTILGAGASGSIPTESTGGNPGAHSVITTTEGSGQWVVVVDLRSGATIDPAVGGILSVDYSEDFRNAAADGNLGLGQSHGPALLQNGTFFTTDPFTIFTGIAESFENLSLVDLQASDFVEVIPSAITAEAAFDFASNPDFSATGAPIQFGYYRANGDNNVSITGRLDNWSVNIEQQNAIPEPSSFFVFMGLGVSGMLGYGWRKRRKQKLAA